MTETRSRWWGTSPTTRTAVHGRGSGDGPLHHRRQPPLAGPNQQRMAGGDVVLRLHVLAGAGRDAAESLKKGSRVIVNGRLRQRRWETPEGDSARPSASRSTSSVRASVGRRSRWSGTPRKGDDFGGGGGVVVVGRERARPNLPAPVPDGTARPNEEPF